MVKPKFSEPGKSWWVCCAILYTWQFGAVTYTVAGTTKSQALPHDFHICTPTHISQFCPNHTFSSHTKLYQCLAFVSVTKDATTPTIICTTLWISSLEVWRNSSCFDKFTAFSSLVGFSPSTHPAHPHLHLICVVSGTFLYCQGFKWLINRTKLSAFSDFLDFLVDV